MGTGRMHALIKGSAALVMCDERTPADADWFGWLAMYQAQADGLKGLLVYSLGGGPNVKQRTEMTRFLRSRTNLHPTAVVTSSSMVRGVVTAINWFVRPDLRSPAFAPTQLDAAFDYLQFDALTRGLLRHAIAQQVNAWSVSASASL